MKKFNRFMELYKKNKEIYNVIITFICALFLIWQIIFTLIFPLRINIIILLSLIGFITYLFFKINWFYKFICFI